MEFFDSLLILLTVAIVLLQVSRRLAIPYPTMLAAAGVGLALIPGAPRITLDPEVALTLFIAPALVDAAFDFPLGAVRTLARPLFALAILAVLLSAGAVACLGVAMAGLPVYAALALGAIVAPPDAAAATAVLSNTPMPRRTLSLLTGEGLLNDASALLLYGAATSMQQHGGFEGGLVLQSVLAVPGGLLAGVVLGELYRYVIPVVTGTLGGNLLEFVSSFGVWIIAQRLGVSAILCTVAFAMTIARFTSLSVRPRMRIHSFAVWDSVVFLLNVFAFLLMGLQVRTILADMPAARLLPAGGFVIAVIVCVIVVRMAWVLAYNRLAFRCKALRGDFEPSTLGQGVLVGWCGMRGVITLAAAFALPPSFPQRDLIVLTAFAVVLATLVIQGLTLAPLVKWLGLDDDDGREAEAARARVELAGVALDVLGDRTDPAAQFWRYEFETIRSADGPDADARELEAKRELGLAAVRQQRLRLERMRDEQRIGADVFGQLQEELDFDQVALSVRIDGRIEEN